MSESIESTQMPPAAPAHTKSLTRFFRPTLIGLFVAVSAYALCYLSAMDLKKAVAAEDTWLVGLSLGIAFLFPISIGQLIASEKIVPDSRWTMVAMGATGFLALYSFAFIVSKYGFTYQLAAPDLQLFVAGIGQFLAVALVYSFAEKTIPNWRGHDDSQRSALFDSKFSLLKNIVWITCICGLFSIIANDDFLGRAELSEYGIQIARSFGIGFCFHAFWVLPMTYWVNNSRPFIAGLLAAVAVPTCLGIYLIVWYPARFALWDAQDFAMTITAILSFACSYTVWFSLIRNRVPNEQLLTKLARRRSIISIVIATGFIVYIAGWTFIHFGVSGPDRTPKQAMAQLFTETFLEKDQAFALECWHDANSADEFSELFYGISAAKPSQLSFGKDHGLSEWLKTNLSKQHIRPSSDIAFDQLVNIYLRQTRKTSNARSPILPEWQLTTASVVGMPRKKVISEFNRNLALSAVYEAMTNSPWEETELPIATQYCREKADIFDAFRKAADNENGHVSLGMDRSEFNYYLNTFLEIESNFLIGNGKLDLAIKNCETLQIHRKSKLSRSNTVATWMRIACRILAQPECTHSHRKKLQKLIRNKVDNNSVESARQTLRTRLLWRSTSNVNSSQIDPQPIYKDPIRKLAQAKPSSIDWAAYTEFMREQYVVHFNAMKTTGGFSSNFNKTKWGQPNQRYSSRGASCIYSTLLGFPKSKGELLAEFDSGWMNGESSQHYSFRINTIALLTETQLAIFMYRSINGRLPNNLMRTHGGKLPLDPFTNRPLIYRKMGSEFTLYSTGQDGVDDLGHPDKDIVCPTTYSNFYEYLIRY